VSILVIYYYGYRRIRAVERREKRAEEKPGRREEKNYRALIYEKNSCKQIT
jgi:hypothetical protein